MTAPPSPTTTSPSCDQDRSESGFTPFYESAWRPSVRFVQRSISDADLAADLVQEGFLRLHVHWERVPDYARSAWLRRVLRNLCTDELRRRAHQPKLHRAWEPGRGDVAGAPEAVLAIRPHEHPDQIVVQQEQVAALHGFFDQLPTTLRAALELSMDPDQDHASTAAQLGCAVKTVSTRVFRARRYFEGFLSRRAS